MNWKDCLGKHDICVALSMFLDNLYNVCYSFSSLHSYYMYSQLFTPGPLYCMDLKMFKFAYYVASIIIGNL